ncbi:MAG: hypothetical protein U0838_05785 [Chloroflexota bacterium]
MSSAAICDTLITLDASGRIHLSAKPPNDLGTASAAQLKALQDAIDTTDFAALRRPVFSGTCPTAYDGQELIFSFTTAHGGAARQLPDRARLQRRCSRRCRRRWGRLRRSTGRTSEARALLAHRCGRCYVAQRRLTVAQRSARGAKSDLRARVPPPQAVSGNAGPRARAYHRPQR